MKPLVSVLIPAYNAERWIAQTIGCVIEQTWPRTEIIVVDDGSSDNTLALAKRFQRANVKVLAQSNAGAAVARNRAFAECQGDYIQWLDADDLLDSRKLEHQMDVAECLSNRRIVLSCPWAHFRYRVSRAQFVPCPLWCDLSPREWLLRKLELGRWTNPATWLVSREVSEEAGPWNERLTLDDDGEYFCRVLLASAGIKFVPEAKVFYRRTGLGSLSNPNGSSKKLQSQLLSMQLHIEKLRASDDSERVRLACLAYLQRFLFYNYFDRPDVAEALNRMAAELGGQLERPVLPRKYAWLQPVLGRNATWQVLNILPRLKDALLQSFDRVMYSFEQSKTPALLASETKPSQL